MIPMSPLFVPLAAEPFGRFVTGEKTVEVRQDSARWGRVVAGRRVLLSRGYGKQQRLQGRVGRVARAPSYAELPTWARAGAGIHGLGPSRFFDPSRPLVAFECLELQPVLAVVA